MANTILTISQITREALRVLHEKVAFIGSIHRDYDDSYAVKGAKIGDTLRIRLPNEYTVRTGAALAVQDTTEQNTTLQVSTQKGVDLNFTSVDLTLSLDDFSERILKPAMSVLASAMEADAFNMTQQVARSVGTPGTVPNGLRVFLDARTKLNQALAPKDNNRRLQIDSTTNASVVDALKGLFQDSESIADQYLEGMMGRTAGFDWYENERIYTHTNSAGVAATTINGAAQTGSTINVATTTTAYSVGSVVTFAGVFDVHPETKVAYTSLKQFVIQAGTTATALVVSPALVTTGGRQNVSGSPANGAAVTLQGAASTSYAQNLAYHKDAFAFATADLVLPKGVDMAMREVMDGLSMRIVRAYDINTDQFPVRLDVLYGYRAIRPQLACRVTS